MQILCLHVVELLAVYCDTLEAEVNCLNKLTLMRTAECSAVVIATLITLSSTGVELLINPLLYYICKGVLYNVYMY